MRGILGTLAKPKVKGAAAALFSVLVFMGALYVLHRAIGSFDLDQVMARAKGYRPIELVFALACCMASYLALCGFDWLAVRHMGRKVPLGWTALISFVSHSISHNAGFAILSGGSVRLRMYSTFGLSVAEVAGVIAFAGLTFALGTAALGAGAFILEGHKVAPLLRLPAPMVQGVGYAIAAALLGYLAWGAFLHRPLRLFRWTITPPTAGTGLAQIVVAAVDLALVAGALYVLLPLEGVVSYPAFVGLYVVATLAGTLSHVPGGLGVFEGALLLLLPEVSAPALLGSLLVFRVFYNLVPLLLGATTLAVFEILVRRRHQPTPRWLELLGPSLGSVLVFGCGVVLLVTGAVSPPARIPAWAAEPAHLLSGATGAVLLASAYGMVRQGDWAWRLSLLALSVGSLLALLRGPDWVSAAILAGAAAVLASAEPLFRHHEAAPEYLPWGWLGAGAAVVSGALWLTLHADHAGLDALSRLLRFAAADEGARAMRGNVMAVLALASAAIAGRSVIRA